VLLLRAVTVEAMLGQQRADLFFEELERIRRMLDGILRRFISRSAARGIAGDERCEEGDEIKQWFHLRVSCGGGGRGGFTPEIVFRQ